MTLTRRSLLETGWKVLGSLLAAAATWTSWELLRPLRSAGATGKMKLGSPSQYEKNSATYVSAGRLWVANANGTLFAAHDAVGALLRDAGRGWWLLGSLERVPGIRWLSGVAYRWIAKNRYRLPGGTPACSLSDRH